jgi:hypothetical protein
LTGSVSRSSNRRCAPSAGAEELGRNVSNTDIGLLDTCHFAFEDPARPAFVIRSDRVGALQQSHAELGLEPADLSAQ